LALGERDAGGSFSVGPKENLKANHGKKNRGGKNLTGEN